ncbi:MAG: glycosyltransferase family 4 protein, partial [Victivallales bacterium]|nr:glycosyltransferase family 4 protein [Victivallales bacterium]
QILTQMVSGAEKHQIYNGVEVFRVNTLGSRYLFPFAAMPVLLRLAKNADLIHTSTFAAALPAWLAARLRGKKVLLTVHEVWIGKWSDVSDAGWLSNAINSLAERMIYVPRYDGYIAVSNATARALQGFAKSPVEVIYNAVDYEHWNPARYDGAAVRRGLGLEGGFLFLFNGRPGRSKGLPVLLRAFAMIDAANARLLVLASRSKACQTGYDEAVQLVEELGLKDKVIFKASVPYGELPGIVAAADCVCVPSLSEGFGFCAAEACAMGVPVIATDNASLPEVVCGRHLLVPPGDSTAFAEAMKRAMDNDYQHSEPKRFTQEANLTAHIALYKAANCRSRWL